MAKYELKTGIVDRTIQVFLQDSSSTTGAGLPGVVAVELVASYIRVETDNDVTITQLTLNDLASLTAAHNDGGWIEINAALAPGWYRLDLPDAVFAAGAWSAGVSLIDGGTDNFVAPWTAEIQLVSYDPEDTVRLGLTALPNAAVESPGGLYTQGAGAGQINQNANGQVDTRPVALAANVITTASINDGAFTSAKFADGFLTAAKYAANAITSTVIADGALTAAKAAAGFFDAVWSVAARILTAGTNILLAKGTGITGFNDLSAGDVRAAIGMSAANLDVQLAALASMISALNNLSSAQVSSAVQAAVIEGTLTLQQVQRILLAASAGLSPTPAAGTRAYRDQANTKNRILANVSAGDRTSVVLDVT